MSRNLSLAITVLLLLGLCTGCAQAPVLAPTPLITFGDTLQIPLRYIAYDDSPANYLITKELTDIQTFDVAKSALVLVDIWDTVVSGKRYYEVIERTMPSILNVLSAARANHMLIIHACMGNPEAEKVKPIDATEPSLVIDYNKPQALVASQFVGILKSNGITTLFYVGFGTNLCVMERPFGIRPMSDLKYNIVLIRDCTTAVEFSDTASDECATRSAIRKIEYLYGKSCLSKDFMEGFQ